ncbi:MAG: hypothetical protein ABID38_00100 [Candidatus Diapherotrites archaeon]
MQTKKIFIIFISLTLLSTCVNALGSGINWISETEHGEGTITFDIHEGWNLVPLKMLNELGGIYWSSFDKGITTCSQDTAQYIWMHSPAVNRYELFIGDDWGAPDSRNHSFLQNEFRSKYFHAHAGSGWIFSVSDCKLSIPATSPYPNYKLDSSGNYSLDGDQPSKPHKYGDLIIKKGWNFIPYDTWMVGKNLREIFSDCEITKRNSWDAKNQKWELGGEEMNVTKEILEDKTITTYAVYSTELLKFADDCRISRNPS